MMNASLCKVLAVAALASSAGCAAVASANAAHSHITPCVDNIAYSVFDLILAAGSTGILVGSGQVDESPAWMLVPGMFVTSGVIGSIFVHRCRKEQQRGGATLESTPAYQPVQAPLSDAPDATPEQLGLPSGDAGSSTGGGASDGKGASKPAPVQLQIDPDYVDRHPPPAPPPAPTPPDEAAPVPDPATSDGWTPIPCGTDLPGSCPAKTHCLLFKDNRGYCVADS
jgi:hypothetical protein